ncbi:pesticin C-terminus-like muramidase [Sorangium sp. KYC3313]|uniref:pesticin C-terminus-like muramidase n=1 Tax=Sorangium sp. KYC3313 TaxID=3449740 RepID=UPI003F891A97
MSSSQSGVTIATGFDLGARGLGDLRTLGLPDVLIGKLTPYLGKKTVTAELYLDRHPLRITRTEADAIAGGSARCSPCPLGAGGELCVVQDAPAPPAAGAASDARAHVSGNRSSSRLRPACLQLAG